VTAGRSPAAAWDAEYRAGRYQDEPPVACTHDILGAARRAGVTRGLYVGCGNGRNYLPLVADGLDLTGLESHLAQDGLTAPRQAIRATCAQRVADGRWSAVSAAAARTQAARNSRGARSDASSWMTP